MNFLRSFCPKSEKEEMSILIFRSRVISEFAKRQMSMSSTLHSDTASAQNTINEAEVNKFRKMAETW